MSYKTALQFAEKAHRGQVRKYTGTPYILHPIRVANMLRSYFDEDSVAVQVGLLHDTIEDTDVTYELLVRLFGEEVAFNVKCLTAFSKQDENVAKLSRKERKAADLIYLSSMDNVIKLSKLCDRVDNLNEIPKEEEFFKVYCQESKALIEVIKYDGMPQELLDRFWEIVNCG